MGYEQVTSIKIKDNKVLITSNSNNVWPKTPRQWEATSLSKLSESDPIAVDKQLLTEFWNGSLQAKSWTSSIKYHLAVESFRMYNQLLRNNFDTWSRFDLDDYEKSIDKMYEIMSSFNKYRGRKFCIVATFNSIHKRELDRYVYKRDKNGGLHYGQVGVYAARTFNNPYQALIYANRIDLYKKREIEIVELFFNNDKSLNSKKVYNFDLIEELRTPEEELEKELYNSLFGMSKS